MLKKTKLIPIIFLSLSLLIFSHLAFAVENPAIEKPKLIIGDDINYPPYSYLDSNGEPAGFNIEIAKAVGTAMGYDVEIKLDEWSKIREALENGKIDATSGMFYSLERKNNYSFSTKHSITNGDIFTNKNLRLDSLNDLKGKTVVVQRGDIIGESLSQLNLNINLIEVSTVDEALELVENHSYDYAALLKLPGLYGIKNHAYKNLKAQGLLLAPNDYCMAVKKGNEDLLLTLNGGLQIIKATGEFEQIYNRNLGVYEEQSLIKLLKTYRWIVYIIVSILIVLILISLTLKKLVSRKTIQLKESNLILEKSNREIHEKNELLVASEEELIAQLEEIETQKDFINFLAYHDPLTTLPNRRKFIEKLELALSSGISGAVILLDLDNFKVINDTMGHVYGDQVLKGVSDRLSEIVEDHVFVSRFGGDEFLILLEHEADNEKINDFANKLNHIFDRKIIFDENEVQITFSTGISLFPTDSSEVNQLIMNADLALYTIKNSGKNGYCFFDYSMIALLLKKSNIEAIIRNAIETDGFKMVFQPQVDLKTGEVHAYEALLRLKHHALSPAEFIPIAESDGTIIKIGRIVTQKVIEQLGIWQRQGYPIKPVSINFSANQLQDHQYLTFISELLEINAVDSKYIEIEITENIFLEKKEQTLIFLAELRKKGFKISIDDFGTGYSSLSYLTFLPIDKIKLDRSLNIKFLEIENIKVMDSLIMLAQSLNLEVVAEGIETHEQFRRLRVGKCNYIQGYYFCKPLEIEEVESSFYNNYYEW